MTAHETKAQILRQVRWPLRLTWVGMVQERVVAAFWPFLCLLGLAYVSWAFWGLMPYLHLSLGGCLLVALIVGARRFAWPRRAEAFARLDQSQPHAPLSAALDEIASGKDHLGTQALWQAHLARMRVEIANLRPVPARPRLMQADPFGLSLMVLTAFAMALIFANPVLRGSSPASVPNGLVGPVWEGWVEPPRYTGLPTLYLDDLPRSDQGTVEVIQGARLILRLYEIGGSLDLDQSLAPDVVLDPAAAATDFEIMTSGDLVIGDAAWRFSLSPDVAPQVEILGAPQLEAPDLTIIGFRAQDDFAIAGGVARLQLDLEAVSRRYGLSVDPEPRADLVLDLPMPFAGDRADFSENLVEDVSKHPLANLPVILSLRVEDDMGQTGEARMHLARLPSRRFFDPLAASLIEQRRDLLWSVENAARVAQVLRALTYAPQTYLEDQTPYLPLRSVIRRIEAANAPLSAELRDELAEILWQVAIDLEELDLDDALAALRQAQERLSEAMRRGASDEEIAGLMEDLQRAMDDYIRELAQSAEPSDSPTDTPDQGQDGMELSMNDLSQMMDQIQELMEQGRMAEAQAMLDALSQMLENMEVTQGQGEGQGSAGERAMDALRDTLREQQGLADESFRSFQDSFGQGGDTSEGDGPSLSERQEALRDSLREQAENLPGQGREEGQAARDRLDEAERAMRDAARALEDGDMAGALDRQADAMDALREGMDQLGRAFADENGTPPAADGTDMGDAQQGGQQQGTARPLTDPLGRATGGEGSGVAGGQLSREEAARRATELLDELRRRSGEMTRPEEERDYLRRLIEPY
ncbi:DUF4175 domain-containing protein [Rhodobacteraceae bacterium XHP0102]|nr:DUF4175 domain-containing protein [Rhodobacteraceae bacterium XHP0102]